MSTCVTCSKNSAFYKLRPAARLPHCLPYMTMSINGNERVIFFFSIAWYYGYNELNHMNLRFHCTFKHSVRDLQYLIRILAGIVVLIRIFVWLAVPDTDSHVTCNLIWILAWLSTDTGFSCDLQYVIRTLAWLVVKIQNYMQLQGFPIDPYTFAWVYK